ncbi:MAG TPA: ABC transporter substrate-binding protein [Candidatus Faecalibacterium faecipullorum]|uniref:ABC transporter substrate-binding protein n=1 Tax=Candidatus Faecalibacterium faecipullorum TaxID=2838578 RepID=A0A9D2MDS6_9FIRM|nr:ABC transporter substrate-binding protein [Candidatus Faecalibacterium faecipullorum]
MKKSISRRQFLAVVGAAAAAGALSACGSSSSSSSTAASTAGSAAAEGAAGATIKVGLLAPLTGDVSVYGIAVANGANLYIKQVNEAGGINGKQIEVVEMDEQGDATQAVTCFTQMVDEGITALIGDVTTTPTLAVVAESQEYNMPMVSASATAEAVTYDAETDTVYQNVFRTTFTDPFQGVKMADYATDKLGYTKAAVIYQTGADYNEGLATNFEAEFASNGGEIVASETYSAGDVDFKTQLTTILSANPEVIYCPNYYEDVGQILSQAVDVGLTVPFLGGDGWDGVTQYATAEQLDGCYFCANYATGSNPDFESAYEAEYGEPYPNGFSPLGYDAALTICGGLQAAEDAGLEPGTDEYKQAVIDGIKNGSFEGVTGSFTFDDHNDPIKTAAILTFENGEAVFVEQY